jgi:hypothetical protein
MNNNPVRYNDPSGHDVGCPGRDLSECIDYRYDFLKAHVWASLPKPEDAPTGYNFPGRPEGFQGPEEERVLGIKTQTAEYYDEYRRLMIRNGYESYIDINGKISDEAMVSLVINAEFGGVITEEDVYDASLSALSYQYAYNGYAFTGPPICGASCAGTTEQLIWLQAFEAIRDPSKLLEAFTQGGALWTTFIPGASKVISGRFGDFYSFGNGGGGRICSDIYPTYCVK